MTQDDTINSINVRKGETSDPLQYACGPPRIAWSMRHCVTNGNKCCAFSGLRVTHSENRVTHDVSSRNCELRHTFNC